MECIEWTPLERFVKTSTIIPTNRKQRGVVSVIRLLVRLYPTMRDDNSFVAELYSSFFFLLSRQLTTYRAFNGSCQLRYCVAAELTDIVAKHVASNTVNERINDRVNHK